MTYKRCHSHGVKQKPKKGLGRAVDWATAFTLAAAIKLCMRDEAPSSFAAVAATLPPT